MSSRASFLVTLAWLVVHRLAEAQVPTASMPIDDTDIPATPPPSAQTPAVLTPSAPTPTAQTPAALTRPIPVAPVAVPAAPVSITTTPSALVPTTTMQAQSIPSSRFARLTILVKEPGSTVYIFPYKEDPDEYGVESALMQCPTSCSVELPTGDFSIRVVSADGVSSYGDLPLRSSRWISVTSASQITRDLGFAMGIVGTASTVLGAALLAEGICDSCTSTARNTGGAIALGLGIPMTAIGWSLYVIHRKARIEDRILTQAENLGLSAARLPDGYVVGATVSF